MFTIQKSIVRLFLAQNIFSNRYEQILTIDESKEKNFVHKLGIVEEIQTLLTRKKPSESKLIVESLDYIRNSTANFGSKQIGMIDAFIVVWLTILENPHREELENRLFEELREMKGLCTTGHIARLINVLQGFVEDENI